MAARVIAEVREKHVRFKISTSSKATRSWLSNELPCYATTYRLIENFIKYPYFTLFFLQLAIELIIKDTEMTVPTIIAGNIWLADPAKKNL